MSISIHTATPDDIFQMEDIMRAAFEASYAHFMPEQYVREWYDNNAAQQTVRAGIHQAAFAEYDGMSAGFAMYDKAVLTELWVSPLFQRKGIATALLIWVEQTLRQSGQTEMHLYCYQNNHNALEFYQKQQFTITETFDSKDVAGGPVQVLRLTKRLTKSD